MGWIDSHITLIISVLTLVSGAGAQARWQAISRFIGLLIEAGDCNYHRAIDNQRELARMKTDKLRDTEVTLLRETVENLQGDVGRLVARFAESGAASMGAGTGSVFEPTNRSSTSET